MAEMAYYKLLMINIDSHSEEKQSSFTTIYGERSREVSRGGQRQKMGGLQGCSQLMLPVEMLDDVTLLRKKIRFLSKTLMKLSGKYYQQEEIVIKIGNQLRQVQEEKEKMGLQNKQLGEELNKIKKIEHTIHQEVSFREQLMEASRQEEKSMIIADKDTIILKIEKSNLQLIEELKEKIKMIQNLEQNSRQVAIQNQQYLSKSKEIMSKCQKIQNENKFLKEMNNNLNFQLQQILPAIGILKLQKKQLQRQLAQQKASFEGISELQLLNLNKTSESSSEKEKIKQLLILGQENLSLKKYNTSLSTQCSKLKQKIQNLTGSQKDIQHIVIDRFLAVIESYKDRLQQGGGDIIIKQNLDIKKDAFLKRMSRQYQKFIQKI